MALNELFLKQYNGRIKDTLMANYTLISSKLEMSGMDKEIREAVDSTYSKYLSNKNSQAGVFADDSASSIQVDCSDDEVIVLEFITLSLISGYYGLSNIDFNISSFQEFGFANCEQCIILLIKSIFQNLKSGAVIKQEALTSIISKSRKISFTEYMTSELYLEDIKHIIKCLEPTTEKYFLPEEDEKLILDKVGASFQIVLNDLKAVYRGILEDAFGLEKYVGVFTFNRKFGVQGLTLAGVQKTIEPNGVLTDYFAQPLIDHYPVFVPSQGIASEVNSSERYSDRQFDYKEIYKGYINDKSKPVYFPHKMLEIIYSMEYSCNIQTQVYKKCKYGNNLEAYLNYLCGNKTFAYDSDDYKTLPPMAKEVLRALSCGFKTKLDSYNVSADDKLSLSDVLASRDNLELGDEFKVFSEDFLSYCFKCFTTCFILTSISNKKEHIHDFRIRVCYPQSVGFNNISYINEVGCDGKYSVEALIGNNAEDIGVVDIQTIKYKAVLQDYAYCSNPKLAYGRPLFAYKALYKMIEQNRPMNWDSILLGKSEGGGLVTSERSGVGSSKIHLQDVHLHYLISGSRSGKGVMGYNILGTALISGLPVFYMDRKPDTASIMKSISPNMFAINGGDYQQVFDTTSSFNPSSLPFKIPPYMEGFFGGDAKLMCDYAYLRGILFALNIAVFMDKCSHQDDSRYLKLKNLLSNGYFIVIDEFTNFTNEFLQEYIVPFSTNGKAVFQALPKVSTYKEVVGKGFDNIRANNDKLRKLKDQLETSQSSGKGSKVSEADIESATDKLRTSIDDMIDSSIDLSKLYWNAFYTKYKSVFDGWTSLKKAGAGVMLSTHLFIIGQDLDATLFDSDDLQASNGKTMFNKSQVESKVTGRKGVASNLFYKFLSDNPSDIITGYQPADKGKPAYMGQNKNWGTKANSLFTEDKRFFAYKRMPEGNKTDFMYKVSDTDNAFKGNTGAAKDFVNSFEYFKPFLILNTGDVPSEEYLYPNPSNHSDVTITEAFENARKKDTGSAQYVAQCITSCNRAGITYDDLLADNRDVNNPNTLNKLIGFEEYMNSLLQYNKSESSLMDILGMSGQIANIIVQEIVGYNGTFEDYIYDFSAEALFDWRDWDNALGNGFSVKESLKDSFFLPFFLTRNAGGETFASVFKDQLGSLYQYYDDISSDIDVATPLEREIKEEEDIDEEDMEEAPLEQERTRYSTPTKHKDSMGYDAQATAEDYYSRPEEKEEIEEEDTTFTKEMALMFINNAINNYDTKNPTSPIRNFVLDSELDRLADMFVLIMNS